MLEYTGNILKIIFLLRLISDIKFVKEILLYYVVLSMLHVSGINIWKN